MAIESALAIRLIERGAEILVALHDVQHVAEHFEHRAIRLGADGGRTGIKAHAGHFAEEIAGAEFGDWIVVREIDWRIDVNESLICVFLALVFPARDQLARQFAEEASRAALRFHMRDGRRNGYSRFPLDNVESRRAVFAFAANHIAAFEVPAHHGAAIQA